MKRLFFYLSLTILFIPRIGFSQTVPGCGDLRNAFGPFDYRPDKYVPETTFGSHERRLNIVERSHFTTETQALARRTTGQVRVAPGADLSYTLRAFPNHHLGLVTLVALGEKEGTDKPESSIYTIDCWFKRAVAFAHDDQVVRMIYATYLGKTGKIDVAKQTLEWVERNAADNPFTYNNLGMIYFDWKDYDKALTLAHKAYELGFQNPLLRKRLEDAGKWKESTP